MDRHIAFINFPHPPHVNPTLPIVSVLVRRGYKVTYVTSSYFRDRLIKLGAEVIECQPFDPQADHHFNQGDKNRFRRLILRLFDLSDNMIGVARSKLQESRPLVLLHDTTAHFGEMLADQLGIPQIRTTPMFALDLSRLDSQITHVRYREEVKEFLRLFNEEAGLRGHPPITSASSRQGLTIQFAPQAIQPDGNVFGEGRFYAGRCPGEQPTFGTWRRRCECGRPLVLVSSSTTALQRSEYYRMCIEALDGLGFHVVLSVGARVDLAAFLELPSHFEIVQTISHLEILRHAALMICMGGNMTTSEALYHGVPLIVLSHGHLELEWQADCMSQIGFGLHIRLGEMNADSLRDAIQRIWSESRFHLRAARMMRAVRREPGAEETANRIEDFATL